MNTKNLHTAGAPEPQADHTRALLFTNGAFDKYCYPLHSLDELMQLVTSDHYQQPLAAYRSGNGEAKRRMLALLPQARLKHGNIWLHTMEWLVPSGWLFLDDDRPATEITAEERHRLVEERLAQLGLQDMPHIALRSASMKYHLLVPMRQWIMENGELTMRGNYPLSTLNSQLRESWEHWRQVFDGVLVLDPSTVNVNRLMFFTGELLTPPETLEMLLASPLQTLAPQDSLGELKFSSSQPTLMFRVGPRRGDSDISYFVPFPDISVTFSGRSVLVTPPKEGVGEASIALVSAGGVMYFHDFSARMALRMHWRASRLGSPSQSSAAKASMISASVMPSR